MKLDTKHTRNWQGHTPRVCTSAMSESNASSAWMTYIAPPTRLQDHRPTMATRDDRTPAAEFKTRKAGTVEAPLKPSWIEAICERTGPLLASRRAGNMGMQLVPPKRPLFFLFFFFSIFPISTVSLISLLHFFSFWSTTDRQQHEQKGKKNTTGSLWTLRFPHEKTGAMKSHRIGVIDRHVSDRRENRLLWCFVRWIMQSSGAATEATLLCTLQGYFFALQSSSPVLSNWGPTLLGNCFLQEFFFLKSSLAFHPHLFL